MAKRGRKPKSRDAHVKAGTYREDRHGVRDPEVPSGEMIKPKDLDTVASAYWDEVVPILVEAGMCKPIDRQAMIRLCICQGEYQRLWAKSMKRSLNVTDRTKLSHCLRQIHSLECQFGLTPTERARIRTADKPKPKDKEQERKESYFDDPVSSDPPATVPFPEAEVG